MANPLLTARQILDGVISATKLGSGAAATNIGALGGVLAGTLPNPTLAALSVLTASIAAHNVSQCAMATGTSGTVSTTSGTLVDLPEMTVSMTATAGSDWLLFFFGGIYSTVVGTINSISFATDGGGTVKQMGQAPAPTANQISTAFGVALWSGMTAGVHAPKIQWATNSGTLSCYGNNRVLLAIELKK